ncbi:MAG: hypothetical protein LBR18_00985 [Tannerella sp.]|nr:hypothetical protein [Tannerella sp.]
MILRHLLLTCLILPAITVSAQTQRRLICFEMQSSELVSENGKTLSSPDYQPDIYWFPVKVPTTVLSGLVANRVYPDPYTGLNNMLIPDANDEFNKRYDLEKFSHIPGVANPWKKPYWFRTSFDVPETDKGRFFHLIFKGINYRAEVWLNGSLVADSSQMAGMFAEYSLEVSKLVKTGAKNVLCVKIYPLDYAGLPDTEQLEAMGDFYLNGGPTGDIGKNVTMLCSVGWDWVPPVRDRNIGIWQPVFLRTSGPVTITKPHLVTELPDTKNYTKANLTLSLNLDNHSNKSSEGKLTVRMKPENFDGETITFTKDVTASESKSTVVTFNPSTEKKLTINNPKLWWANGYGEQNLYTVTLRYEQDGQLSDEISFLYGLRTVSSNAVQEKGKALRRDFYLNGRRIHLAGGAWVPDFCLQRDSARYVAELQLCKNANINLVRIWGGGITPPDVFFDLADRYGLLVWSDFWITGDTQGEFKGSPDWPLEGDVFKRNVVSTVLRIRNHPSLLVWTGGNEGHARKELYEAMRNSVIELDGTRPFIPCSSGFANLPEGWQKSWPDNKDGGVYSGGPYTWQSPEKYYELIIKGKDWVFKDETGIPSQPTYNSLKKIIPNLVWDKTLPFPLNHTWGYHDACTGNGHYELYYEEMVRRYGKPLSIKDFSDKMQLMNYVGYQGIFESAADKLNNTGGVMLWKLNAAFPSVVWQVYDWYLNPNSGYYAMQRACEPVHIQHNPLTHDIVVVNRSYQQYTGLQAEISIYNLDSKLLGTQKVNVTKLPQTDVVKCANIGTQLSDNQQIYIVLLRLTDSSGKTLSRNTYWLNGENDFTALARLPKAEITVEEVKSLNTRTLHFTNKSDKIAFFLNPQLITNGEEISALWSDNYFTLAPGEQYDVTVKTTCLDAVIRIEN